MKKFIQDFKEFAVKGNMIEIAIGVILGTAFNKVVDVLVKEIFMPPLSLFTNGINLANKKVVLRSAIIKQEEILSEEIAIGYGKFLEVGIDFLIISLTVFLVIKLFKTWKDKAQDTNNKEIKTPKDIELLHRISCLIEEQNKLLSNNKAEDGKQ